jgi:ABC-2 type transport system ATP-binding protein
MIQVENLSKRYRDRVAVDELSFEVKQGEILGFLGPNGAGKSTTMRVLTGFLPPSSGIAKIDGYDVFEKPLEVKRRIGYLPEIPPLYTDMTVVDFLKFASRIKGVESKRIKGEVERVANLASVADVMDRVVANISKGYKQRVGMAQALLNDPPVLILDEPTVGLDPSQIIEVRELIKSLAGKHTIILSTHILPEVTMTCQKVLIINKGKRVAYDDLTQLAQKFKDEAKGELSLEQIFLKLTTD